MEVSSDNALDLVKGYVPFLVPNDIFNIGILGTSSAEKVVKKVYVEGGQSCFWQYIQPFGKRHLIILVKDRNWCFCGYRWSEKRGFSSFTSIVVSGEPLAMGSISK
jgi:hypothetical protein